MRDLLQDKLVFILAHAPSLMSSCSSKYSLTGDFAVRIILENGITRTPLEVCREGRRRGSSHAISNSGIYSFELLHVVKSKMTFPTSTCLRRYEGTNERDLIETTLHLRAIKAIQAFNANKEFAEFYLFWFCRMTFYTLNDLTGL